MSVYTHTIILMTTPICQSSSSPSISIVALSFGIHSNTFSKAERLLLCNIDRSHEKRTQKRVRNNECGREGVIINEDGEYNSIPEAQSRNTSGVILEN